MTITKGNGSFTEYMKEIYPEYFFLNPVTEDQVIQIVMNRKYSSPGYDGISAETVKFTCSSSLNRYDKYHDRSSI